MAAKSTENKLSPDKLLYGVSSILVFLAIVFIATTTYLWIRNDDLDNKVDQTLIFVVESIGSELTAAEGNMIQALSAQEDKETTI